MEECTAGFILPHKLWYHTWLHFLLFAVLMYLQVDSRGQSSRQFYPERVAQRNFLPFALEVEGVLQLSHIPLDGIKSPPWPVKSPSFQLLNWVALDQTNSLLLVVFACLLENDTLYNTWCVQTSLLRANTAPCAWALLLCVLFLLFVGWYLITYQVLTGGLDFESFQCPKVNIPTPVLPGGRIFTLECVVRRSLGFPECRPWVGRKKSLNCSCGGDSFIVCLFSWVSKLCVWW